MWGKIKSLIFKNISTRQTVAKNTLWLSISNIGGRLLRAIIIIYAARVLGAAAWGTFSYALSLAAFLTSFIDMGINAILTRETSKADGEAKGAQIISTSFVMKLALIALGIIVILFAAPHLAKADTVKALLPFAAFIFAFDAIREFGFSLIRAMEKMEREAALFLLTNLAIVVAGFVMLRIAPNAAAFASAYAVGTGVGSAATVYALRRKFENIFSHVSPKMVKTILASAWPIAISGFLGILLTNTDILIIGWFRPAEDVGYYSAVLRIVQLLYILPSLLALSVLPTLSRLAKHDDQKFKSILERIISVAFLIAVPTSVGGFFLGSRIVSFVFGREYMPAIPSFQLLILTIIVDFSATILVQAMFAYDGQRKLIAYSAIGGILNVALDLCLIPLFGITGSALATFLAQIVSNAYLWRTVKKVNRFEVLPRIRNIVSATVIMAVFITVMAYLNIHVVIIVATAILVYGTLLVLMKDPLIYEVKLILKPAALAEPTAGE